MSNSTEHEISGFLDRLARIVSVALSPLVVPVVVAAIAASRAGAGAFEILIVVLMVGLTLSIAPLVDVVLMIRRGKTTSLDVPNRKARTEVFVVSLLGASAAILLNRALGSAGHAIIHAILVASVVNLIAVMLINLWWKISVHMLAIAGALAILLALNRLPEDLYSALGPTLLILLTATIPLVGWSRKRLGHHSPAQIAAGAFLGFVGYWLAMALQLGSLQ